MKIFVVVGAFIVSALTFPGEVIHLLRITPSSDQWL